MVRWLEAAAGWARTQQRQETGTGRKIAHPEHEIQRGLIRLVWLNRKRHPLIHELLYAIPNGAHLPRKRSRRGVLYVPQMTVLKAEGLKLAMPDLHYPVARGGFIGLYLETKAPGAYPSAEQRAKHRALEQAGHCVVVYRSAADGWNLLRAYDLGEINGPTPEELELLAP